ncbi:MAG: CusA/CzcA family heavy metal efflux RND transporter [Candidatus Aminicenantes bacterium]|nr:CusA/CzcA family heavy metal efflux RND transporter [Candidatus Aminicenantes bacterium]
MIEKIIAFSLRQRTLILIVLTLIVGVGLYSFLSLPIDAFPDVTNIQVEVVATAPGLSPLEIEKFVTYPVEMAMRGLPGLDIMRSVTKYGISVITLVFQDKVDIYFARQLVFQRLAEAKEAMPENVQIEMGPVATAMGEIYQYTLEGPEPADAAALETRLTELRTLQDWVISPLLKSVPGVSEVNSFGGYIKQFQVIVDLDRLLKYGLSAGDVYEAIRNNNQNVGGGFLDRHSEQFLIRGIGLIRSVEDISRIVLKSSAAGVPVTIADVAEVRMDHAVRQGAAVKDGKKECVGGVVMLLRGENSRDVVARVEAKVAEINDSNIMPARVRIEPYYKRSDIIVKSIDTVTGALAVGSILVIIVLFLFLRSVRGAFVVILALPLSALLTFMVMKSAGLTANLISLGGLAICIGMIIDATIIQVENVQRHLSAAGKGKSTIHDVFKAVIEVRKPSIFGELIIALTFLPIVLLQGYEGKMFSPLAFTVGIALLASLLLSIFVIPVLCSLILKPGHEKESFLLRAAKRAYLPLLKFGLKRKAVVIGAAVVLLAAAIAVIPRLGTEFLPVMDEGAFDMDFQLLPGVSLDKALEVSKLVEQKVMAFPEMAVIVGKTGQTGIAIEARGVDKTGYVGALRPRSEWKNAKTSAELMDRMRQAVADVPGMVISFSQPIQCRINELMEGTRAEVLVKVFGEDMDVLKSTAEDIARALSGVRGAKDILVEQVSGQPYISITVDRAKIARYGINVRDVLDVIEIAVEGKPASLMYEENKFFDIITRFTEDHRDSIEKLRTILISAPGGYRVPLGDLAVVEAVEGPAQISRENGQRRIGIEMNVAGRDIGGFVREARAKVRRDVPLPSATFVSWGGQFENQQRAMARLMVITPAVIALIFFLLLMTFKSARLALLVLLNLPFALIGGVFALLISGLYLSVPASVGFIVLFGVAVLNGLVLVSYVSQLQDCGMPVEQAILKGTETRLRPVLMTASIGVFSLIPMLFATGPGSEIQKPLAVVVVGGLISSTLLTLLVLPVLYGFFRKKPETVIPESELEAPAGERRGA